MQAKTTNAKLCINKYNGNNRHCLNVIKAATQYCLTL